MRLMMLCLLLSGLSGCAWLAQTSRAVGDSVAGAAAATADTLASLLKSTPYDAPGTSAPALSPEVAAALDRAAADAPAASPQLQRLERAMPLARSAYDRAWLLLQHGKTLALLGRCDDALLDFLDLRQDPATPPAPRLEAEVELGRIRRGVCWNVTPWRGYRYRPAPAYPLRTGHPPIEGDVELLLHVNHRGGVEDVVVIASTHKVLELQTLLTVRRWRFQPLKSDGVAIPFALRQKLLFRHPAIYYEE